MIALLASSVALAGLIALLLAVIRKRPSIKQAAYDSLRQAVSDPWIAARGSDSAWETSEWTMTAASDIVLSGGESDE